jgi:putative transcription antitermination factor YqgF
MRYLGIDYGKRKIGLALSEGRTASPLKVLEVSSLIDALNKVGQVIKLEGIEVVVVGIPESGESLKITRDFIKELKKNISVVEVEETLSSKEALNQMIEMGLSRKNRGQEDAYSATIILQTFLDSLQ